MAPDLLLAKDASAKKARILIVDDAPANLTAMQAVLEPLGQELVLARSGEEALKHLLQGEFALIVMDVQMPGLDGLETARLIRQRKRTAHIPLIFVTALSREAAYVMRGYAQGAVDYLLKPIDPEILRSKVSVFVELFLRGERLKEQAVELCAQRQTHEQLQRTAELGQQLVGIVGHDLRSPLSAVLLTTATQLRDPALPDVQRQALLRVARGAERMREIVDVLLDFTRARLGGGIPIRRRRSDLAATLRTILEELRTVHPDRVFDASLPEGAVLGDWDGDRLAQVVANLLDNAVKYSPAGSSIRLELAEDLVGRTLLRIHNFGPPIPPEQLPTLFEPFRRASAGDANAPRSLGLGLYIASSIVRAHGGTLSVRSGLETGTCFEVCLPAAETQAESPRGPVDAAAQASG